MNNNKEQRNNPIRKQAPQKQIFGEMSNRDKAVMAERHRIEAAKRRKIQKAFFDKAFAIFIFALIGAGLCLSIIFTYIFIDYSKGVKEPSFKIEAALDSGEVTKLSDSDCFFRDGEYYVSLTKICELYPFTLHGDVNSMTLSAGGEFALFDIGTRNVNVCGTYCLTSCKSVFEGGKLFVPVSFFSDFGKNVDVSYSSGLSGKKVKLDFKKDFSFKGEIPSDAEAIPYNAVSHLFTGEKPKFKADLSEYEKYMAPENKDEYLILINKYNKLGSDYIPNDLVDIRDTRRDGRATQQMRLYAAKSLEALFIEMRANGFTDVSVTSGYRSYAYQQTLFDRNVAAFGGNVELAQTEVAIPGSSEHQSGLCVDMHNMPSASQGFSQKAVYKWLYSNCADFGFILRFPKDKTDITEIIFEPWHYRYVGRYHAQKIMGEGLCLEEYMEKING